jgi:arylsulfatase A-like enzyme
MAKDNLVQKYSQKQPVDDQDNAVYAAMIESVDSAVGQMLASLTRHNLLDNTLILFFSDNGGLLGSTSNKPLRSGKGYPYEGGIREPMFVYWKGKIHPGAVCHTPVSSIDFFPTLVSILDARASENTIDGMDISPLFFGKSIKDRPLFWHFPHYRDDVAPYSIIREGDWKLIRFYDPEKPELYNLSNDPGESADLSHSHPDIVKKLDRRLDQWLKDTDAKMPVKNN